MSDYQETLNEARRFISGGMALVQNASIMVHDFDKSKPLNILYKELRASHILLEYYTGGIKELPTEGYEIATPQSIRAYHNLNE